MRRVLIASNPLVPDVRFGMAEKLRKKQLSQEQHDIWLLNLLIFQPMLHLLGMEPLFKQGAPDFLLVFCFLLVFFLVSTSISKTNTRSPKILSLCESVLTVKSNGFQFALRNFQELPHREKAAVPNIRQDI